jgi:hypothetical protein
MSFPKSPAAEEHDLAQVLLTQDTEAELCIGTVHQGRNQMFSIFTNDENTGYTPILLDPHTTSPGNDEPVIVRNTQRERDARESEIYQRARQIYYRGRRTSIRRSAGII